MTNRSHGLTTLPVIRHLGRKPRLVISMGAGILVFAATSALELFQTTTGILLAWNTTTLLYLAMAFETMLSASHDTLTKRARYYDDGEATILVLTVIAAALSVVAIVAELATTRAVTGWFKSLHIGLAALTLLTSWAFIHTAFAFHYAHGYYAAVIEAGKHRRKSEPCLIFPGTKTPHYTDFLYFSFVIGTSGQTADVSLANSDIRRTCLIHCVLAYLFNATVLALTINIAASLIS